MTPSRIAEFAFHGDYPKAVTAALDGIGAADILRRQTRVLLKPNLVNASPHPVTTPAACVEAVLRYVQSQAPEVPVVVAEGCGALDKETDEIFDALGYRTLGRRYAVELVDLNDAPTVQLRDSSCSVFPEFHLPRIALESFIVSIPVLKAHTLAGVTLTMKNMMGFAPPAHYNAGSWKKSAFHARMDEALLDLNRYRRPDLTVLDASVGMATAHLSGPPCDPPVNRILASFDPVAVDKRGCELLDIDWRDIPHIAQA